MNFIKSTVGIAILSILAQPVFAGDKVPSVVIYGEANLSFQSSDEGDGSFTEIKSNASRLGFKGTHQLQDGLEVIYKIEFQVDLDGDSAKGDSITDRNQYVGLKGSFGEILLGKNDTMVKQSAGKVDLFNDLNADIKHIWKGENRMADTLSYKSPKMNGFQVGVTYIAEDSADEDADNAYSVAVFYGDKYLKKSKLFASVAMDSDVNNYDVTRATVQGKIAGITLGAMIQTQEKVSDGSEMDGYMISAKYGFGKATLKGQFQTADKGDGNDLTGFTLGVDYKRDKSTKLYSFFTTYDMDSGSDEEYLAAGIQYKF